MNRQLIEALARLSTLNPAELAVVRATAGALADQTGRASPERTPTLPRVEPRVDTTPPDDSTRRRLSEINEGWLDLLGTTSWTDGTTVDDGLFASAAYRRRLDEAVPTLFYAAGSPGLRHLGRSDWLRRLQGRCDGGPTTALRMASLAASRYGACVRLGDRWVEKEGFDCFSPVALPLLRCRGRGSPVQPALRAIVIDRPANLPLAVLDTAVRTGLEKASLSRLAASDEAAALVRTRGLDPAVLDRYTPGPRGAGTHVRHKRATELALIGPRADADHIADLLERIVAGHVMGTDFARPAKA